MDINGHLYSGAPVMKKYQVAATITTLGVPHLVTAANGAGLAVCTTTGVNDMVGVNLDTATVVTAQQTDGTSVERTITVDIRPDAIYKARLSGGATSGTALTLYDVTTASTDGLAVTTGDNWSSPEFDEGAVWGFDGANAGQLRKITSTSTTAATVTQAFDQDTAVGDNFLRAPYDPWMGLSTVTLTTTLEELNASSAVATNTGEMRVIEILARDNSDDGRNNSYALLVSYNHALNQGDT